MSLGKIIRSADCPSKLGKGWLDFVKARYDIPRCIGLRYPERGEKLEEPLVGHDGIYLKMLEFCVCLPLHASAKEFLNEVNLALTQLSSKECWDAIRVLLSVVKENER